MGVAWPQVQPEAPLHTQSSSQFAAHVWVFGDLQVVTEIRPAQRHAASTPPQHHGKGNTQFVYTGFSLHIPV